MVQAPTKSFRYTKVFWGEYAAPADPEKQPTEVKAPAGISIDAEMCKGCELCVYYCPQETLAMAKAVNSKGTPYAEVVLDNCTGCQECARVCPDVCIKIWRG